MTIQASFGRMLNNVLGCGTVDVPADSVNCALGYSPKQAIWEPIWRTVLGVSIALWPLTLAILVVVTAKNTSLSGAVGWADLKTSIGEWVFMGILSAGSLFILDYTGRLFDLIAFRILSAGIDPSQIPGSVAGTLLNTGILWALMYIPGGIFFALFYLTLGFTVLTCLVGAYVARYALMFALICLAPLTLTLGVLPPARWLSWSWLRGYVIVALIAPVNALLMRAAALVYITAGTDIGKTNFAGYLLNLTATFGILSLLITLDYEIAKFTFGSVMQVAQKAWAATVEIATVAVAAAAGVAAGVVAAPAAAGAGGAAGSAAVAGAGEGTAAASGVASAASTTGNAASLSGADSMAGAASTTGAADGTRNSGVNSIKSALARMPQAHGFSPSAAFRTAGDVLRAGSHSGAGRSVGAGLSNVGHGLEQGERDAEAQQQSGENRLERGEDMINRQANLALASAGINPYSPQGREMASELTGMSREYGEGPTMAAARTMLSADATPLPDESYGQMARRQVTGGLVAQGSLRSGDLPSWSDGLRHSLDGAGADITPAERALGANIAQGLDAPQRANAYADLVYGMRMASLPAGVAALTLRHGGYAPTDGWSDGIDATTPFGAQHVEAVVDSLYAARQASGSPEAVQAEFGRRLDEYAQQHNIDLSTFGPTWEQEHRRLRSV